jgi:hypothetical protein
MSIGLENRQPGMPGRQTSRHGRLICNRDHTAGGVRLQDLCDSPCIFWIRLITVNSAVPHQFSCIFCNQVHRNQLGSVTSTISSLPSIQHETCHPAQTASNPLYPPSTRLPQTSPSPPSSLRNSTSLPRSLTSAMPTNASPIRRPWALSALSSRLSASPW